MNRSLHHPARSPVLRVLAAVAWLLLVVLPVHGESMAMNGAAPAAARAAASHSMASMPMAYGAAVEHGLHAAAATPPRHAADCCGAGKHGPGGGCRCAATAGSALAAVGVVELLPLMPADTYPAPRRAAAPDVAHGPPLRPPAA